MEKDKKVLCPICGVSMKLETHKSTSYFQCEKDFAHRMTLPEYSDMSRSDRLEDDIRQSIEERAQKIRRQKEIQNQIDDLKSELEALQTSPVF